jgi:hypothetical protein
MTFEITLPAKTTDDLSWGPQLEAAAQAKDAGKKIIWIFDLGIDPVCSCFTNSAHFSSQALALTTFTKIYPQFAASTEKLVLASSALYRDIDPRDECEPIDTLDEPFRTRLAAMTLFADYLHRLASFLPEEVTIEVLIDGSGIEREILLSKERFRHLTVRKEKKQATVGCVIPNDEFCDAKTRLALSEMLAWIETQNKVYRCIPEALLNEEWSGLDTLVFFAPKMTRLGHRMAQGFIASGAQVLYFAPT